MRKTLLLTSAAVITACCLFDFVIAGNLPKFKRITSTPYVPPTRNDVAAGSRSSAIGLGSPVYYGRGYYPYRYGRYRVYSPYSGYGYSYYPHSGRYYHSFTIPGEIPPIKTDHLTEVRATADPVTSSTSIRNDLLYKYIDDILHNATLERQAAARELGNYSSIQSVAALLEALINDAGPAVRVAAAKSLGDIADRRSYIALMRVVQFDSDALVRNAAAFAIDEIRATSSPEEVPLEVELRPLNYGKQKLGSYLEKYRLGLPYQRKEALERLGRYRGTQAVTTVINALINDPEERIRIEAARQLNEMGDSMAVPFLKWTTQFDLERDVRRKAAEALEDLQ